MKKQTANRILVTTLMLVTAMLIPNIAWAQDNKLALTLVSSDANSFENQGPDKLVYGQAGTALMWCSKQEDENGNFVPFHIIVKTDKRTMLKSYDLYEYSYIDAYEKADWKDWAIYGTNDDPASATAQWTEVHKVTGAQLFNGAWGRKHTFTIDNNTSAYTYYKVLVTAVVGKTKYESSNWEYIQMMGHMVFYGETPNFCDNGEHLFGELTAAKAPTCTEAGNIAYHQCKECEKYFDLEGNELAEGEWVRPAAGHQLGDLISVKEPTCTEAGASKAYHQCSACNKYFDEEGNELTKDECVIPALGHDIQWVVIQELTCTQKGIEGDRCVRCGGLPDDYFGLGLETAAPGHRFELYSVDIEPTCTEYGTSTYKCRNCGEIEVKPTNPQHNFGDDLKCINCDYFVDVDCVIEYTATERLSNVSKYVLEDEKYNEVLDYTDKIPDCWWLEPEPENFGEYLFGAPAIKHEYDEATGKGRIICNAPVTGFMGYTELRPERLTSITLPSTVEFVDGYAFFDCSNLTSITLLTEFSAKLNYSLNFIGCNNLQEIIVPYNSYADYVEAYKDVYCTYDEGDGIPVRVPTRFYFKSLLPLDDTKTFETPESEVKVDATLQRSFANDGWYSLCVPFSVSVEDSPFSQVAEFSELDGDTYRFTTVDAIEAGKAYIVKVDATVANPTFKNVFITTETPATDGDFIGVYSPTELSAGCKVIGTGTTVNPANPGTMKGFRAYFKPSQAGAKAMRFTVDDGEATDIQSLTEAEGYKLKAKGTYNLAGQKVDENYRGIVVRNGKKVLVK